MSCVPVFRADAFSKPVPSNHPEHRGVQEVQAVWEVPGLHRRGRNRAAGHENSLHHLRLAIQAPTQIWSD